VYGSSTGRALYGMGDYQARSGYAGGYYAAGGFFSGLKKLAGGAVKLAASKGLGGALFRAGAGMLPGVGTALQVAGAARASPFIKNMMKVGAPALGAFGPAGKIVGGTIGAGLMLERGTRKSRKRRLRSVEAPRARKRRSTRRSPRRGSKRRRGDWGDDGGRDTRGHFLNARGGHAHFRKRRRSRRPGTRVSFVTKSGKRVSFTAR